MSHKVFDLGLGASASGAAGQSPATRPGGFLWHHHTMRTAGRTRRL